MMSSLFPLQEKPHKCTLCSKSFPTPGDLRSHMYVHNGSWPFKCDICHRGFSKQTNLKNHVLLHSGKFIARIQWARTDLSQRGASSIYFRFLMLVNFLLMSEMVSVSEEIGHSQHTSYWIPRSCLIPPLFIVGDKPHECILCGKKFALQCNLKTHMKTHEGISFQMEEFTILLP